jgi:putative spermidine/putrescine transport system permease protein
MTSAITKVKTEMPISSYLHLHPKVRLRALLALPMTWIVGVYIISLLLLRTLQLQFEHY